ncbi:hypothetical protein DH2020_015156 [Rehmannia glutinosa]|uniref:Phosphoinositide phospholipase C n=1 Tax=Rehmannia glutinosa TaxID=99300 RepID=A0ABR0X120_REHGL
MSSRIPRLSLQDFTRAPKVISYSTWACLQRLGHARWEVQGDDKVTKEEAEAVMEFYLNHEHKHLNIFQRKSLSIKEFFRYLLSHNSYLTGNQISSDSSEVPVIEALRRGVRVIELGMWPNSTKDDIDIMHGGAIKANAFVASEYPVILTLEDHLTPELQAKVAEMVSEIFGDILARFTSELLQDFPSPDSLKRRVIISTKPPKEYLETKIPKEESDDCTVEVYKSSEEAAWGKEISDLGVKFGHINDGEYQDEDDYRDEISISSQQNAAPVEYKHLIAIRNEKMKGGIKAWLRVNSQKVHRVSLNEEKIEKAVVTHGTEIVRFNQRNLMRVYPKATRIDSSNFNPFIGWMHGAQMVAFNMQGHDRSLWLMQGMFRANGGCGYVKKPDILLNLGPNNEVFDPKKRLPVKITLKIGIAGVPFDSAMRKTKAIEDNWMPVWNEEFEFPLTVPELALLRIEVHEFDMSDKDDFGGQTCLPVSELKTGIRAVPLHDHRGDKYKSVKLLMRFDFV